MTRGTEARFWQAVGAIIGVLGGFLIAYDFGRFGLASIDSRALMYGMAASFMILAGAACYIAGRALHVGETRLTAREAGLWKTLATVCLVAGAIVVFGAWRQRNDILLDRMAMGSAGAFSMMFGVLCLMGERVMTHMHDVLAVGRTDERSKVASIADR